MFIKYQLIEPLQPFVVPSLGSVRRCAFPATLIVYRIQALWEEEQYVENL